MVGASAAISGTMAAAMRFAFQRGGPLAVWRDPDGAPDRVPALPLMRAVRDPPRAAFLGVWFGLNVLFGLGSLSMSGDEQTIAWQAHIGGFLAGLLLFALFDRVGSPSVGRGQTGSNRAAARWHHQDVIAAGRLARELMADEQVYSCYR